MLRIVLLILFVLNLGIASAQKIISDDDFTFLGNLTKAVIDSSRIHPGQAITPTSGTNNTGGVLIRPGGRDDYPAFWIRDYAMSIESGFITAAEQKHMLLLTASTQCDRKWTTAKGGIVPVGSIADHIRIDDSKPVYYPGTYSYEDQGDPFYGVVPPYCDQFYFVDMAYHYVNATSDTKILTEKINGKRLIDRLALAFNTPSSHDENGIVYTSEELRAVDFGFRDGITITGDLLYPSILKCKAAYELSSLYRKLKENESGLEYFTTAALLTQSIQKIFYDGNGMLLASTGLSAQRDVWASALAVYYGVVDKPTTEQISKTLAQGYKSGALSYKGQIRHIMTTDDFNEKTAWEKTEVTKNRYQNGAYWGTPTGWVAYTIAKTDPVLANKLVSEYITDLRENDFRKGPSFGAPYECIHAPDYKQNPIYMTSVACPYIALSKMLATVNR